MIFFSQVHFYIKSDILIACMDIQLRIFKLNAMLTNAFNVGGVQGQSPAAPVVRAWVEPPEAPGI